MTEEQKRQQAEALYPDGDNPAHAEMLREAYIRGLEDAEPSKRTLKSVIGNTYMLESIVKVAQDPTIVHKKEQIGGRIFNALTDDYWDYVETLPKVRGWVARDKETDAFQGNGLCLHSAKPVREGDEWSGKTLMMHLPESLFPDLAWESEPIEVELLIHRK